MKNLLLAGALIWLGRLDASFLNTSASASVTCAYTIAGPGFAQFGTSSAASTTTNGEQVSRTCPAQATNPANPAQQGTIDGSALALGLGSAAYGDISADARGVASQTGGTSPFPGISTSAQGAAQAEYNDAVTVTGLSSGFVRFIVTMTGNSTSFPNLPNPVPSRFNVGGVSRDLLVFNGLPVSETIDVPFSAGVPISFQGWISFSASGGPSFGNTLQGRQTLVVQVLDASRNISSAARTFESGASYTDVPEPGTLALLGSGLGAILLRRRMLR